jgi:hypothetical protein
MKRLITICLVCAVVFGLSKVSYAPPIPPDADFWQPHYYSWWYNGVDIEYWFTDKWGLPMEENPDGTTRKYKIYLPQCDKTVKIGLLKGAKDISYTGTIWDLGGGFCNVGGESTGLNLVGGLWETDLKGAAENIMVANCTKEIHWPSGFACSNLDAVYWGVDIATYFATGLPEFDPMQEFHVVNGTCADLPGYVFGTSPVYLDPAMGLVTDNPLLDAIVCTHLEEGMCPEPATVALLGLGALSLIRKKRA